jgi:hypothetical protein
MRQSIHTVLTKIQAPKTGKMGLIWRQQDMVLALRYLDKDARVPNLKTLRRLVHLRNAYRFAGKSVPNNL